MASKIAEHIIEKLNELAEYKLPSHGVIAGQSVAELYLRYKNIDIYTRIKDLDLYINTNSRIFPKKYDEIYTSEDQKELEMKSYMRSIQKKTRTSSLTDVPIEILKESNVHFKITKSYDYKNINIVHCSVGEWEKLPYSGFLKRVVENFDLNSVKIGVCLKSKSLYVSDDFKKFLKTKQVQVVNYNRAASTFIRLAMKKDYYKGAYINMDYESNLLLGFYKYKRKVNEKANMRITKEKYNELGDDLKKEIEKYFFIKKRKIEIFKFSKIPYSKNYHDCPKGNVFTRVESFINDGIQDGDVLDIIVPRPNYFNPNNLYKDYKSRPFAPLCEKLIRYRDLNEFKKPTSMRKFIVNSKREYLGNNIIILKSKVLNLIELSPRVRKKVYYHSVKNNISLLLKNKENRSIYGSLLGNREGLEMLFSKKKISRLVAHRKNSPIAKGLASLLLLNANIDCNLDKVSEQTISPLIRHLKIFRKLILYIQHKKLDASKIMEKYSKALMFLEKNNMSSVIGYMESNALPVKTLEKSNHQLFAINKKLMARNNKTIPRISESLLNHEGFKINHVNETMELEKIGNEMSHCVGGYKNKLSNLSMLFFDVYNSKNVRYTLSADFNIVDNKPKLCFDQFYGKYNKAPLKRDLKSIKNFLICLEKSIEQEEVYEYKKDLDINVA